MVSFTGISYSFFEDQFSGKHSYEQVCDILEQQAISAVDTLSAPTLDISVINQISYKNKKFVPERDKELRVIQRERNWSFMRTLLENNVTIDSSELELVVEQTLCLLGSANKRRFWLL